MAYERVHWANGATALSAEHMNNIEDGIEELISGKVDKVSGKDLSTNDYTTAEKTKLSGVATGAEVNQNAFSNVKVGSTTVAADSKTDTLELVAGSNVTLTPDTTNDKVTIAATDTKYSAATTSAAGLMSASDKVKLNGIATEANKISFTEVSMPVNYSGTLTIAANSAKTIRFTATVPSGSTFVAVKGISLKVNDSDYAPIAIASWNYLSTGSVEVRAYNPTSSDVQISKGNSFAYTVFATGA